MPSWCSTILWQQKNLGKTIKSNKSTMKRILICLLTFISLGLNVNAQTISVADVEALSEGGTVQFKLHVSGVTAMTSMHFEVELPATFSVSGVSATTDWAAMFSREG